MTKKSPKQYEIDSFEKLINVIDEDNFSHLTTDLLLWLNYHILFMKDLRKSLPKKTKGKTNWDLCHSTFIYIADGKHEMNKVIVKNKLTGEVRTIGLKKQ